MSAISKPPQLPRDPVQRAKAIVEQVTGPAEVHALPAHVVLGRQRMTCARCGKTFVLSKEKDAGGVEMRAFGTIHACC
jgi:hypothetical protein